MTVDALESQYERADIDARRGDTYDLQTHNIARLTLPETASAREIKIDGQSLKVKPASVHTLEKSAGTWKLAKAARPRPAQTACPARPDRRRVPRSLPPGPPDRNPVERRRQ